MIYVRKPDGTQRIAAYVSCFDAICFYAVNANWVIFNKQRRKYK